LRDTDTTAFTGMLTELIGRVPGAHAAALVDADGESVDYAGDLDPFDVKVAAAHWRIVLGELDQVEMLRGARVIVVRGATRSFIVRSLPDRYAVVVVLRRGAGFSSSPRAFSVFERSLQDEAGIGRSRLPPAWTPVRVKRGARGRPEALLSKDGRCEVLEVLGAIVGLGRRDRGYRVRLATGFETTLVREPGGAWYADETTEASGSRSQR
jgi:hypothetical protein